MYRTIPGLEHCEFTRPAYAIEYDCIDPADLKLSLEYKTIDGLFFADKLMELLDMKKLLVKG